MFDSELLESDTLPPADPKHDQLLQVLSPILLESVSFCMNREYKMDDVYIQ